MGYPVGEADGEYPALYVCNDCDEQFENDETTDRTCPHCGSFNVENDTPTEEMKADENTDGVYDASYWR